MKICPECAFANEERFPACLLCNALLTGVPSVPAVDPAHPEHTQRRLAAQRHARRRGQLCFAMVCYSATVTLLAVLPGLVFKAEILAYFFLSAAVVSVALTTRVLTQFPAMIIQGVLSTGLVLGFDLLNLLTAFMLVGHVIAPAVLSSWIDLIDDACV